MYTRVPQKGTILVSWGTKIRKGGAKIFGDELILDIFEMQMKSKKKVLAVYISNFETYTRDFRVADEKQKPNKS